MEEATKKVLRESHRAIYGYKSTLSKNEALEKLEHLSERKEPVAMLLLGHALWEGISDSPDINRAFCLTSEAAATGYSSAMTFLGAMHMVGAGCRKDFDEALKWYRLGREAEDGCDLLSPRLRKAGLMCYEFRDSFSLRINDRNLEAPVDVLEKLNHWRLDLKARFIDAQQEILSRNPGIWDITSPWDLPFKGYIGGSYLRVSGENTIEKIGYREDFVGVKSEFWMSWSDFPDAGSPIELGQLSELQGISESDVSGIRKAYLGRPSPPRQPLWKRLKEAISPSVPSQNAQDKFEILMIDSPVHREVSLSCAGDEIYSSYKD